MSIEQYNEFFQNPLSLKERFPTIEEFALAFDDFFILKKSVNRTDYDQLYAFVKDGTKTREHRKIVDKDTIEKYIGSFDLKGIETSVHEIIELYICNINKPTAKGSTHNSYIRQWFRPYFAKAYGLRVSTTDWKQLGNMPPSDNGNDFFDYISYFDSEKIEKNLKDSTNKKNFKNWRKETKESKSFVKIQSILDFLDDVNSEQIIVNKENLLITWFYSKCFRHFPCNESLLEKFGLKGGEEESLYAERMDELNRIVDGPKNEKKKKFILEEIKFLKENVPTTDFPVLLYQEFKHEHFQKNYSQAVQYAEIIADIFFYVGSHGESMMNDCSFMWFLPLTKFAAYLAYNAQESNIKTKGSKLLSKLLKHAFLVNFDIRFTGYNFAHEYIFSNTDEQEILKQKYNKEYHSFFLPSLFYDKQSTCLELAYDENKINQKIIDFNQTSGYAIELAAQINDPLKVEEIIAKGGDVTKSKNGSQNALYWSICNMLSRLPIGYWRFEMMPHSTEHLMDETIANFIIPQASKTLKNYSNYNNAHAEELEKGLKIFNLILPKYKEAKFDVSKLTFMDGKNLFYTTISIGRSYLVQEVLSLYNTDSLKKDSENYFLPVIENYNQFFKNRNGIRQLSKFEPFEEMINLFKNGDFNNEVKEMALNYYRILTQKEFLPDSFISFIDESELLKIIDILIENHFDPCKDIENKPNNFPSKVFPLYDCTMFAIEMGWLKAIKRLCNYIISEYPDHWKKMGKCYFAEAIWQWQINTTRYPTKNERILVMKYLSSIVKIKTP